MLQKIGTILLVTVLTLLVWMWAEGEILTSGPANPRVQFTPPTTGDLAVRVLDENWNGAVAMTLRGSPRSINAAQRSLATSPVIQLRPGVAGGPGAPGVHTLQMAEVMREEAEIRNRGVSVAAVEPATVRIMVEPMVVREVPVRLRPLGIELSQEPIVRPATVKVRIPASAVETLGEWAFVLATADLGPLASAAPEGEVKLNAELSLSPALADARAVGPEPVAGEVIISRGPGLQTATLPSVPVIVTVNAPDAAEWIVTPVDAFVSNANLQGPASAMAKVVNGKTPTTAVVVLAAADLKEGEITRPATLVTGQAGVVQTGEPLMVRVAISRKP